MTVPYAPCPVPGSDASQVAMKKQKAKVSKKPIMKKAKVGPGRVMPSKTVYLRPNQDREGKLAS
jgi:hypothetical protein